jgi:inosose dehydratase
LLIAFRYNINVIKNNIWGEIMVKVGISTYCLMNALNQGEMTVLDLLQWAKDNGCEHIEFVPYGYSLVDQLELADAVRDKAITLGLDLSSYSIPANFYHDKKEDFEAEISRLKQHVDLIHRMGIKSLRHDVVLFRIPPEEATIEHFNKCLPQIIEGSQRIADYAAQFGITTNIENHGWGVQHSDRVQQVLQLVNRSNFKTVLDIGNFMCVDEPSLIGVKKNLTYASIVHVKDFYYRPFYQDPGEGKWFRTVNGNYLRGSIFGQGDLPIKEILSMVKQAGYDGYLTLEFEGMEECKEATRIGLNNLKRLWSEIA